MYVVKKGTKHVGLSRIVRVDTCFTGEIIVITNSILFLRGLPTIHF